MFRLFEFLYRRRVLGLFLILEGLSFWLLFSYNRRYNSYYLNSSNRIIGEITERINSVNYYFNLQKANTSLAEENLLLRKLLTEQKLNPDTTTRTVDDSVDYHLTLAKVVNSVYVKPRNFITLRINAEDSVKPGMGVVTGSGIVGRVKSVSRNFATVYSLLHSDLMISSRVKSNKALCTVQWDGADPLHADLKFVPRHLPLVVGDTVMTSGFGGTFPEAFMIGTVETVELKKERASYDASIRLSTDFTTLHSAYVVHLHRSEELEELENELDQ